MLPIDSTHQISAQVRQEVGALLYGGQPGGGASRAAPSEPLVHWLSQQYITGASLQAALASLERRLLQNIRRQRHHVTLRDMSVVAAATVSRQVSRPARARFLRIPSRGAMLAAG